MCLKEKSIYVQYVQFLKPYCVSNWSQIRIGVLGVWAMLHAVNF